jgi:hypothetical protein
MSENVLTTKQQKAIAALLSESTIGKAAAVAGVSEKTLHRWLDDSTFRAALQDAEGKLIDGVSRFLLSGQTKALRVLSELMENANDTNRRLSAIAWLDLTIKMRELNDIEERLSRLEDLQ